MLVALAAGACAGSAARQDSDQVPTFTRDVAPILFEHCVTCHRPGQGAPFALLEYEQARRRVDRIVQATGSRRMPPWLPEPHDPPFVGERGLTPDQVETIRRWAEAGALEGDPSELPEAPTFAEGWTLGTPDLVLSPPTPYTLPPGDEDVFRNLVIPLALDATRFVRAVEFRPEGAPVHHAIVHVDRTSGSRRRDGADGQPGFDGMGGGEAQDPAGHFVGWAPGRGPIETPEGMPWALEPGMDLVIETHLIPGDEPRPVQPTIALFFSETPPEQVPLYVVMGSRSIEIPAGARDYAVEDAYKLPVEVEVLSLYPHAHYLGKEMRVQATLPDGTARDLLHITQWSFDWQQDYRYVTPVRLPAGTTISMRYTYDNSEANSDNPHHPPRLVTAGQRSTDEMGNLGLQLLPRSQTDRLQIVADFDTRATLANVAGGEMLVRNNPNNAHNRAFLGGSYVAVGRIADAMPHLEAALRLDPRSATAQNEMAGALLAQGRPAEAVEHYRQAAQLEPGNERLQFNYGKVLAAIGQLDAAERQLASALRVAPEYADAHNELGVLLFSQGRLPEALVHLRRAVELAPDSVYARSNLGGALAQAGQFEEALAHVRRALELDPNYEPARENLIRLERRLAPR
jgi:tetratricopeptide (TPR) repeat protein